MRIPNTEDSGAVWVDLQLEEGSGPVVRNVKSPDWVSLKKYRKVMQIQLNSALGRRPIALCRDSVADVRRSVPF